MTAEDSEQEPAYCGVQTNQGSLIDPPYYCENEVAPGAEFCPVHDPDADDPRIAAYEDHRLDIERGLYDAQFDGRGP
jgi:hypothetical protein